MARVFFTVKVCSKEQYRDAFLDGHLHMNTLGFFKRFEEGASANIADQHEGTIALLQPELSTITIQSEALPGGQYTLAAEDLAGPTTIQHAGYDALNVFCLYAVHERGWSIESEEDFERFVEAQMLRPEVDALGDYAVVVANTDSFLKRVSAAIRERGFRAVAGLVDYYDPTSFNGMFDSAQAVLKKRAEYPHQREYRFAVDRGVPEGGAYTLEVGPLRDIAVGCRTDEVNELIRGFLHQLRAQGVFG